MFAENLEPTCFNLLNLQFNNQYGFAQKFGRFEVKAKLNHGPGSWPAHWLLPEDTMEPGCGWPYSGEIDIMEATFLNKNVAGANFHTGDCQKKNKDSLN